MGEKLGYRPALDGLRAVSIALVLVFHLGAPWLPGGYLGVSVFFTLSGFLITSLLLHERAATGGIAIRAFYVRRLRRLLPASLVCLAGIAMLASAGTIVARSDLRSGVLAAVFQVANWQHLLGHRSYADLFVAPSPVDHFWSLAVEEQFYWLWPVAIAAVTAVAARGANGRRTVTRVLVGAFAVTGVGAFATARLLGGDAAYFASWARFAEILAGAALAAVVADRRLPARLHVLAAPSLVAVIALAILTPAGRGWAYQGGLPLFALLSVVLILGVLQDGPITRLLAREPVPWIGRISYGLYLFHWPVFTALGHAGVVPKLSLTVALTVTSYYVVERPIRTGKVLALPLTYVGVAASAFLVVAGLVAAVVPAPVRHHVSAAPVVMRASPLATAPIRATSDTTSPLAMSPADQLKPRPRLVTTTVPTTLPPPPTRVVALFGDSIADWLLRDSALTYHRTDITLIDAAVEGCDGAADMPPARGHGRLLPMPADCRPWPDAYPAVVESASLPVETAVLVIGNAPIVDHRVGGRWIGPCEDLSWYVTDVEARIAYLRDHVHDVVLALPSWGGKNASFLASTDHLARSACIRTALADLATRLHVPTIDLAVELCPDGPDGACNDRRTVDGVHVDHEDAPAVLDWLLDHLPTR